MPKSLKQVLNQIEKLQKEADAMRAREVSGVVARIREAIEHYGLTPEELFGSTGRAPVRGRVGAKAAASKPGRRGGAAKRGPAVRKSAGSPKYQDGAGRTWTGVGKRPNWFKEAIASGKTAEDLLIQG
ncbi:H-NS histone family protein [Roseateles amylovorans]|jgi:DNA-binding protein H-NS|uniref:H-NS histone family protein n=1 Tax=Roseateles amylovorans TaxID=2978473 RepID=A0ABY6AZQ6_9BURK|nr:H-NS histone family protein [Roseateles amylovorans]UXH78398.1 H-NS histone family protein [Roseateles amylovorans]